MTKELDLPQSPYKFLDYYKRKDRRIFFGRKAETRILLSDVVVQRLVVLFAKTGTGKTSIINAGVRPILQDRGYETFFIRVKEDPVESARKTIIEPHDKEDSPTLGKRLAWRGKTFAEQLENVARALGKPIVLFFDQFEEFFIYPIEELRAPETEEAREERRREHAARKQGFVASIAALYHNPESRVHFVFSMREEWFVEMDIFRNEIPKIFHNDSNLRLRWFDESQARDAIKLPAQAFGVEIDDEVVDTLIKDLSDRRETDREIEPAQLQIVCDTLWLNTEGERITLKDYQELGRLCPAAEVPADGWEAGKKRSVAERILFHRLEQEFTKIRDEEHLYLLYAILPKLRTEWKTKYVREVVSLNKELARDEDGTLRDIVIDDVALERLLGKLREGDQLLRDVLRRLRKDTGLIRYRKGMADGQGFVELSHDYLVGSLDALQRTIKAITPMRLLKAAMARHAKSGDTGLATAEESESISRASGVLSLNREQSKFMLRSALFCGPYKRLWFERVLKDPPPEDAGEAKSGAEEAWEILRERINDIDDTSNVIDLLFELQTPEVFELLKSVLPREEIASHALAVFSRKETLPVVELLEDALGHDALAAQALAALERLSRSRNKTVAERAELILSRREAERETTAAGDDDVRDGRATRTSGPRPFGEDDTMRWADAMDEPRSYLGEEPASTPTYLEPHYRMVLKSFVDGRVVLFLGAGVNMAGRRVEDTWKPGLSLPSGRELASHMAGTFGYFGSQGGQSPDDLARVSQYAALTAGKGALYEELRHVFAHSYTPTPLHRFLASLPALMKEKGYAAREQIILTTNYDDMLGQAFREAEVPFDTLTYIVDGEYRGRFLHEPFRGEARPVKDPNTYMGLTPDRCAVIIRLSGGVSESAADYDSFVITEDDYIDQLALSDIVSLIPVTLAARLRRSHFLFLGYGLRDWNLRVILRRLWGEQKRVYKSWAIQHRPARLDQEFWLKQDVDVLDVPLERYVEELKERFEHYEPR